MSQEAEKVRSKEDEEALDKKIAEIRKKNELIARRKEEVDKDRETFATEVGESQSSATKENDKTEGTKPSQPKGSKASEWDREWDAGKTSADTWKENVPEMGRNPSRGGYSSWGSLQRGRGARGRGRGTPRNEFSLHDDRTEPKRKSERHVTSANGTHLKVSVTNDTAQKGKDDGKKPSQRSARSSDRVRASPGQQQPKRDHQSADHKKLSTQTSQTTKDEVKVKKEGEKRPPKEETRPKTLMNRSDRGRGRGASANVNRSGRGATTAATAATRISSTKDGASKATGFSKRYFDKKRPIKSKTDSLKSPKEASNNGKQQRPTQSTPPIENGKSNDADSDVIKELLNEVIQQVV